MLEEELVGLSLSGEDGKASQPISPRTIKRPTNPVATCLDATRRFRGAALQGEREVVKRPRLGGNPLRGTAGALVPSPPTLSPAMASHPRDIAVSNTPSNAPSTHASPVHRCAFSTRQPVHEGLAEPQPVFAAGAGSSVEYSSDAPSLPPSTPQSCLRG